MRRLLQVVGGLAVIAASFLGTLAVLDLFNSGRANNELREQHIKSLSGALEKYRQARGFYPLRQDAPVDDLKRDLVDGGFIAAIPSDPAQPKGPQYRYAGGANTYGLLVTFEPQSYLIGTKAGFTCTVGVKIKGSGAWGDPPLCQF
ncbi:hypothetical protein JQ628_01635 [Bradyrhizobium lablabi]|uniref:hypothetical protein n=1 Tax=Bradyrhizobium lablabi TaxID=722472 RepID=UPI001BAB5332|nr:hypothetical protein [Bradyrhizobium lablabi]MBR1120198.1 hypothetical protein [Bradyrhizobium lablabi]